MEVSPISDDLLDTWHLRLWLRDVVVKSRFFPLLAALVLLLFIVHPLVASTSPRDPGILLNVFVVTTFVVSLRAIASDRRMLRMLLLIAIPMFATRVWAQFDTGPLALIVYSAFNTVFLGAVLLICLSRVLDRSPVNEDKIMGAICVYILMGVIFSFVYEMIYTLDPHAIDLGAEYRDSTAPQQFWVFTYFSFVTMTTLGYGDVLPLSPFARSMATLEAIIGPLYLAILIARLVSLAEITTQRREKSADEHDQTDN